MTTSAYMPDVKVEIAFNAGVRTPAADRVWTDVSAYVELDQALEVSGGRQDERSTADAGQLRLVVDNSDGRFTPGLASGAYYPNVKIGRPIRVTATHNAVTHERFTGYVDEWPTVWDGTDDTAWSALSASSRLARLGSGVELADLVSETIRTSGAVAHWTLGDPEGSAVASEAIGGGYGALVQDSGSGTAVSFGSGVGSPYDGLTAAVFAAAPTKRLENPIPWSSIADVVALAGTFRASAAPSSPSSLAALYETASPGNVGNVYLDASGQLNAYHTGGTGPLVTTSGSLCDGETHTWVATWSISSGTLTVRLYVDGSLVGSATTALASFDPVSLWVGGLQATTVPTTMAHIALWVGSVPDATQVAAIDSAISSGFAGETVADRLTRLAGFAGVPTAELDLEVGQLPDLAPLAVSGQNVAAALQAVVDSEGGVLFDGRDGSLVFHDRAHRYGSAPVLTLDVAAQEVEAGLEPRYDRALLLNDVSATTSDGLTSARVVDQGSIDDYGLSGESLELLTTNADEPYLAASWRVNRYAEPLSRIPSLAVRPLPLSSAQLAAVLALEVGDRIRLTGLPPQAPSATEDYFVEGYTEAWTPEDLVLALNVSPASVSDVLVLDVGHLDTDVLGY